MWPLRNQFVHQAELVEGTIAAQTIACAKTFRSEVVGRVAKRLGFTLETTRQWSVILKGTQVQQVDAADPFVELAAKMKKRSP
jgi:hypothetical protein